MFGCLDDCLRAVSAEVLLVGYEGENTHNVWSGSVGNVT